MSNIIIESVGFSGTQAISKYLEQIGCGNNYVTHGSRNFELQTVVGVQDLPIKQFCDQMLEKSSHYENAVAVHCLFSQEQMQYVNMRKDVKLYGIFRKSQKKQVISCYFWLMNRLLCSENAGVTSMVKQIGVYLDDLAKHGIKPEFKTALMLWSMMHVLSYNLALSQMCTQSIIMEDFVKFPVEHAKMLGLFYSNEQNLGVTKMNSHKDKFSKYEFMKNVDDLFEIVKLLPSLKLNGKPTSIEELDLLIFEKNITNLNLV